MDDTPHWMPPQVPARRVGTLPIDAPGIHVTSRPHELDPDIRVPVASATVQLQARRYQNRVRYTTLIDNTVAEVRDWRRIPVEVRPDNLDDCAVTWRSEKTGTLPWTAPLFAVPESTWGPYLTHRPGDLRAVTLILPSQHGQGLQVTGDDGETPQPMILAQGIEVGQRQDLTLARIVLAFPAEEAWTCWINRTYRGKSDGRHPGRTFLTPKYHLAYDPREGFALAQIPGKAQVIAHRSGTVTHRGGKRILTDAELVAAWEGWIAQHPHPDRMPSGKAADPDEADLARALWARIRGLWQTATGRQGDRLFAMVTAIPEIENNVWFLITKAKDDKPRQAG